MTSSGHRAARILAFQITYQRDQIGHNPAGESLLFKDTGLGKSDTKFARKLIESLENNSSLINRLIERNLTNWKTSRLTDSLNALLQIAVAELQITDAAKGKMVINEALEICKQFVDRNAVKICNGVLDAVWKVLQSKG